MQALRRLFKERFYHEGYVRGVLESCGFKIVERVVLRTSTLYSFTAILALKRS